MASLLHMEPRTENASLLDVLLKKGVCIVGRGLNCSPVLFQVWVVIEGELRARRSTTWEEVGVRRRSGLLQGQGCAVLVDCWVWGEEVCLLSALDFWVLKAS